MSRSLRRERHDDAARIMLLEDDADSIESHFRELRKEMNAGFRKCEKDSEEARKESQDGIDGLRKVLTGLLIAIVVSSISIVGTVLIAVGGAG